MSNIFSVTGRMTREPKVREVGEQYVVNLGVVDGSNRVKKDGEWVEEPLWLNVEYWTKNPDYVKTWEKGEIISVTGKLRMNTYQKDGEDVTVIVVKAYEVERTRSKKDSAGQTEDMPKSRKTQNDDDDVPF